jgi:hypothetical protein
VRLVQIPTGTRFKLTLPGFELARTRQGNREFVRVEVPGAGTTLTVGRPELPVVRRLVTVPEGTRVKAQVKTTQARALEGVEVFPVQGSASEKVAQKAEQRFAFSRPFYRLNRLYPTNLVTVSGPMTLPDRTVVLVEIALMQYNGARKTLSMYPHLDVELSFW